MLATAGHDGSLTIRSLDDGRVAHALRHAPAGIACLAFHPSGRRLAMADTRGRIKIWELENDRLLSFQEGHGEKVLALAFSPDGGRLVSGSRDHSVRLWNCSTGKLAVKLQGHTQDVTDVAFSPDGLRIVSAGLDQTTRIWDPGERRSHRARKPQAPFGEWPSIPMGHTLPRRMTKCRTVWRASRLEGHTSRELEKSPT